MTLLLFCYCDKDQTRSHSGTEGAACSLWVRHQWVPLQAPRMELEEETKEEHWQVTRCQAHAQLPFFHSPGLPQGRHCPHRARPTYGI